MQEYGSDEAPPLVWLNGSIFESLLGRLREVLGLVGNAAHATCLGEGAGHFGRIADGVVRAGPVDHGHVAAGGALVDGLNVVHAGLIASAHAYSEPHGWADEEVEGGFGLNWRPC